MLMWPWRREPKTYKFLQHIEGVLGTSLEFQSVSEDSQSNDRAFEAAIATIEELENVFSAFRPESELMRWQRTRGEAVPVSSELAIVLSEAEQFRSLSRNAFCPVADALSLAWREGRSLPELDPKNPLWTVNLDSSTAIRHTALLATLNAIAKGYIVDRALESAMHHGVSQAMVNIGGDLRHAGAKSIPVEITDPTADAENSKPLQTIRISNQAVATSGGYRRGFTKDGERFSHVFDAILGHPAETKMSVSVIADSALEADAVATVASILPYEDAMKFANSLNRVGVLIVSHSGSIGSNPFWSTQIVS